MSGYHDSDRVQRERSRSPRRRSSRSPRRSRRSYTPRSRSRSRDDYRRSERRSRSPLSASGAAGSGSPYGGRSGYAPSRTFEDRTANKENMMQSVRDSSQQDRRVYVGNLSYDVKWHHLKDFMRQGEQGSDARCVYGVVLNNSGRLTGNSWFVQLERFSLPMYYFFRMECRRWAPMCRVAGSFSTP